MNEKNKISNRNKLVVEAITSGELTVGKLAEKFGISRERVCQIYSKETGLPRGTMMRIRKRRNEDKLKFNCAGCGIPVTVGEGLHLHKYCKACHEISQVQHRIMSLNYTCLNCFKKYHPLAISVRNSKGKYCTRQCYLESKSLKSA